MLKNKFKIVFVFMILFLFIFSPFINAVSENIVMSNEFVDGDNYPIDPDDPYGIMPINNDNPSVVTDDPEQNSSQIDKTEKDNDSTTNETQYNVGISNENYKQNSVYLTGDDIIIDYVIDGNLFIMANSVSINSSISGDVFVCAKNVTINNNGYIMNNLFATCNSLNIQGVSYNVYALSSNIDISGYVYKDLYAASNNLTISGIVHRNAYLSFDSINFIENSNNSSISKHINGILDYSSEKEVNDIQNNVEGEVTYTNLTSNSSSISNIFITIGTTITTSVLIWLLLMWLAPKFEKNTNLIFTKKILPIIGFGILTLLAVPVISIILLLLGITSIVSLLLFSIYLIIIAISSSLFVISINNLICNKLKISKNIGIIRCLKFINDF